MSMDFNFDFTKVHEFGRLLEQSEEIVSEELRRGVDRTTMQGEGFTKEKTPVLTGHLRRSISFKPATYGGGVARGSWGTVTPYAEAVEKGRKAIVAPPGKALVFKPHPKYGIPVQGARKTMIGPSRWQGLAVYKSVKATKGVFMFKKALVRIKPIHRREMDGAIKRIITRLGGHMMASVPDILRDMATAAMNIPGIKKTMYPAVASINDANLPVLAFFWGDEETTIAPSGATGGDMWLPTFKAQLFASSLRGDVSAEITAGDELVTPIVDFFNRPLKEWMSPALFGHVHRIECVRVRPSAIISWPDENTRYYGAEFIFTAKFHRRRTL